MLDTNLMQQVPLTRDLEATPPAPNDTEPRTERHDWLFVGYKGTPKKNDPPLEQWVREDADLARSVEAFAAREAEGHRYPYIFLAPGLGVAFEEQATHALVAAEKRRGDAPWPWPDVCSLVVDFTPSDAAFEEVDRVCAIHGDNYPPHPAERAALESAYAAEDRQIDAAFTQLPGLDPEVRKEAREWAGDTITGDSRSSHPLRRGTIEDIVTASIRAQVHARLYAAERDAGGWHIWLTEPDRDWRKQHDLAFRRTPGGTWFRTEQEYRRFEQRHILPVSAKRLLDFIDECHDEHNESCRWVPGWERVAAWMKEEGIRDPAPPTTPLRSAADLLADQDTRQTPTAVLPHLAWPGRLSLLAAREKDGKSTLVGSAVAAMTRGTAWLGQPTTPTNVLWLYEEPDRDFKARLQQFAADLTRVFPLRLPLGDADRELAAALAQVRPGLVVIDSLIRYAGHAITNASDSTQWARVLTPLATLAHRTEPPGPAILVLHHAGKKDGEYRDSSEIGAAVDMLLQMPRGIERGNRQRLDVVGRIIGIERYTITVELAGTTHQLVTGNGRSHAVNAPAAAMSDQDRTVLNALVGTMRYTDWFAASGLRSKSTFSRSIQRLAGMIDRTKDGQYRRLNRP